MSELKHTPGPWEFIVEDFTNKIVAPPVAGQQMNRQTLMCNEDYYLWCPSNDADWHLIAAAPDLLHASRELMGHISDVLGDAAFDSIDTKKWNALSAAIAKASPQ